SGCQITASRALDSRAETRGRASTRYLQEPASISNSPSATSRGNIAIGSVISAFSPTSAPAKPAGLTPTIGTGLHSLRISDPTARHLLAYDDHLPPDARRIAMDRQCPEPIRNNR